MPLATAAHMCMRSVQAAATQAAVRRAWCRQAVPAQGLPSTDALLGAAGCSAMINAAGTAGTAHLQDLSLSGHWHALAGDVEIALGELAVAAPGQLGLVSPVHLHTRQQVSPPVAMRAQGWASACRGQVGHCAAWLLGFNPAVLSSLRQHASAAQPAAFASGKHQTGCPAPSLQLPEVGAVHAVAAVAGP